MHFPLDISENLVYMIIWEKNPWKVDVHSRFTAIPFAVRDFNFHLIVFPSLSILNTVNNDSMAILIQAETT